jgi:hypothetical protein
MNDNSAKGTPIDNLFFGYNDVSELFQQRAVNMK